MATLITLPHEIQSRIAHFLRPPKKLCNGNIEDLPAGVEPNPDKMQIDPFEKAKAIADIKCSTSLI